MRASLQRLQNIKVTPSPDIRASAKASIFCSVCLDRAETEFNYSPASLMDPCRLGFFFSDLTVWLHLLVFWASAKPFCSIVPGL